MKLIVRPGILFSNPLESSGNYAVFDAWSSSVEDAFRSDVGLTKCWICFSFWGYDGPSQDDITKVKRCYKSKGGYNGSISISSHDCSKRQREFIVLVIDLTRRACERLLAQSNRNGENPDERLFWTRFNKAIESCFSGLEVSSDVRNGFLRTKHLQSAKLVGSLEEVVATFAHCAVLTQLSVAVVVEGRVQNMLDGYSLRNPYSRSDADEIVGDYLKEPRGGNPCLVLFDPKSREVLMQMTVLSESSASQALVVQFDCFDAAVENELAKEAHRAIEELAAKCTDLLYFEGVFPVRSTTDAKQLVTRGEVVTWSNGQLRCLQHSKKFPAKAKVKSTSLDNEVH